MALLPSRRSPALPRLSRGRLAALLGAWLALAGGAILVGRALDSPVGAGTRDKARPAASGPVAALDDPSTAAEAPAPALFLEEPLPAALIDLPPARQAARLRARVAAGGGVLERVELGAVLQQLGDEEGARRAYLGARRRAPADLRPRVGLAMVAGATGGGGPARAAAQLARLAAMDPTSQLVAFNQGVLAASSRRAEEARAAWARTAALGARTRLGQLATVLLRALVAQGAAATP